MQDDVFFNFSPVVVIFFISPPRVLSRLATTGASGAAGKHHLPDTSRQVVGRAAALVVAK